ncbi:MAG: radical SAM protein [Proteobacteria bacterium]|nr:radical SAM protein [Pseudomonadota bacterium]
MGPTGDIVNVVQIHPTRRCNLRCEHCYSASGPDMDGELPLAAVEALLGDLVGEGFNAIAISGGEPFMWRPLPRLLESARAVGLFTSVTTNGLLLDPRRLQALAPHLSLLAVSVDGMPESHDRLRASSGAFGRMRRKLSNVRDCGIPFGVIFTLTLENLNELAWVTAFAAEEGASLVQVHPLERVGRARDGVLNPPDDLELACGFLEVARLQAQYRGRLTLQFDAADRTLIEREPCRAFAIPTPDPTAAEAAPLASLVSPLVLQEDGWIVPVQHGFGRRHAIAHLGRGGFRAQASRWKRDGYPAFLELSRRVWDEIREAPGHLPFTNWYGAMTTRSSQSEVPSNGAAMPAGAAAP